MRSLRLKTVVDTLIYHNEAFMLDDAINNRIEGRNSPSSSRIIVLPKVDS